MPPQGATLLGGVELVWPCWKKCFPVEVGFEVSYAQDALSVSVHFLFADQDVELSAPSPGPCLLALAWHSVLP